MRIAQRSLARAMMALWLLAAGGASAAEPMKFTVTPIRQFGHVIGDDITLDGSVDLPAGYAPDPAGLPKPGRVGAFLELRGATLDPETGNRHRIHVHFLVVNSAPAVRTIETPPLAVHFRKEGANDLAVLLPEIPLTVSPLTPSEVLARDGLEELQPDFPAPHVATGWMRARLLGLAVLTFVLAGWFAWAQGWLPTNLLAHRPFARARTAIVRLGDATPTELQAERARRLHRAFDESAGFVVTGETLERFFAARPAFASLRDEIGAFFTASGTFFYAEQPAALPAPAALRTLAQALAECELATGRSRS